MLQALFLVAVSLIGSFQYDDPDLIVLADGTEIACRVLYESADKVVIRVKRKNHEYARAEVAEVTSIERSLREFLGRYQEIRPDDVGALGELALFCEANDLAGEARNLWIRILTLDEENERAWTKLGGSHGRKGWRLKVRGRYYTPEQLKARVNDWKNAMEITTAHFLLKTDVDPTRALDLAIDAERAYQAYYDILGPNLDLYCFDKVPEIHYVSSSDDYKSPPTPGADAWFSVSTNTLHVRGTEDRQTGQIMAVFTDVLLYNSFHSTLGKNGNVAPWLRKGLGVAMSAATQLAPGKTSWEFGVPNHANFRFQSNDGAALGLEAVVRAGHKSFDSSADAQRHLIQSYTLFFFLAYGADGAYRPGLTDYARKSFLGRGSTADLKRSLDVDLDELEKEWRAFVDEIAGN